METGVAHPAPSWQTSLVLLTYIPSPPPSTTANSLHVSVFDQPLIPKKHPFFFSQLALIFSMSFILSFATTTLHSIFFFPLYWLFTTFLVPLSALTFSPSDSWALTAFYVSFSSATVRELPGIGGLVQTNRGPCGSPRVATRHNKPPAPGRRMQAHSAHSAHSPQGPATGPVLLSFPRQPDSNISCREVLSDGRRELRYRTTWLEGLTWNQVVKNLVMSVLVRKIPRRADI